MARPRGGAALRAAADGLHAAGVDLVVSALEADEAATLGLAAEEAALTAAGIEFFAAPVPDHGVPPLRLAIEVSTTLHLVMDGGGHAVVHCYAGIGRSSLLAACALVGRGMAPAAAWETIGRARGLPVPDTEAQRWWLHDHRDGLLAAFR